MKKPRVVLDTNVLISAVIFGGLPRKILQMIITGDIIGCLSIPILDEMKEVLQRRKFGYSAEQSLRIVEELYNLCDIVVPAPGINAVKQDPDDNRILECALGANADFIISGDSDLLSMGKYKSILIIAPSDFLEMLKTGRGLPKSGK